MFLMEVQIICNIYFYRKAHTLLFFNGMIAGILMNLLEEEQLWEQSTILIFISQMLLEISFLDSIEIT